MPIVVWLMKINFSSAVWFGTEFRVFFSSAEGFGREFREYSSFFVPRNGIPSSFLHRWSVLKGIPRFCFYFCSTERNSEFFSSAEEFGTEFREFLFRGTAGIPSEIAICSVYSVFRGIIFLSEIPNPKCRGPILEAAMGARNRSGTK